MAHVDQHMMQLEKTHESGAEEWYCPICERRLIVQWPPDYKKIILNLGDETVSHRGEGNSKAEVAKTPNGHAAEAPVPEAWREAIESLDFSSW